MFDGVLDEGVERLGETVVASHGERPGQRRLEGNRVRCPGMSIDDGPKRLREVDRRAVGRDVAEDVPDAPGRRTQFLQIVGGGPDTPHVLSLVVVLDHVEKRIRRQQDL